MPLLIGREDEKILNLNYFRLGDGLTFALEAGLSKLFSQQVELEQLHCKELSCTSDGIVSVCRAIAACPQLRVLDLSGNCLGKPGGTALALALRGHKCLQDISLVGVAVPDGVMVSHYKQI